MTSLGVWRLDFFGLKTGGQRRKRRKRCTKSVCLNNHFLNFFGDSKDGRSTKYTSSPSMCRHRFGQPSDFCDSTAEVFDAKLEVKLLFQFIRSVHLSLISRHLPLTFLPPTQAIITSANIIDLDLNSPFSPSPSLSSIDMYSDDDDSEYYSDHYDEKTDGPEYDDPVYDYDGDRWYKPQHFESARDTHGECSEEPAAQGQTGVATKEEGSDGWKDGEKRDQTETKNKLKKADGKRPAECEINPDTGKDSTEIDGKATKAAPVNADGTKDKVGHHPTFAIFSAAEISNDILY
jgi:hypothetical protein